MEVKQENHEKKVKEIKQDKGLKRNTIDKYYTKQNIVSLCLETIRSQITINFDSDLIIEPSAGNGSFVNDIKMLSKHYLYYDIIPEHEEIVKQDYLKLDTSMLKDKFDKFNKIHVIGNPPFGRQSSLAIQFIKKSCGFCDTLSFILPKSFKKDSLKKTFLLDFHLICEMDLPENSFMVHGLEHNVPCVFQIWEKRAYLRKVKEKVESNHFVFVKKDEQPDISFRRVGVNAGVIDTNTQDKSIQSHYFIKFTNDKNVDENIKLLKNAIFSHNNTVGPKSISKQELINVFETVLSS
jgi:predicted RNA methylase